MSHTTHPSLSCEHYVICYVDQVGDIVKVTSNNDIPCDLLMLSSSDDEGQCYITTLNLDGETNLKVRSNIYCTPKTAPVEVGLHAPQWRVFRVILVVCSKLYNVGSF